ncbi:MAG TPA: hypothetical protein VF931_08880 [Steroidobacteraceae bacterium]
MVAAALAVAGCGGSGAPDGPPPPPPLPIATVTGLDHRPPESFSLAFLLTDGTVMVQGDAASRPGTTVSAWYKLTPDAFGSYVHGSWSQLASLPAGYVPYAYASAVLADGRVVIVGGEYNQGLFTLSAQGAVYDPRLDHWTLLNPPAGWDYIGDIPAVVLPDGRFLVGRKLDEQMAALDPLTLTWTALAATNKSDFNAEEGWTLMPDGSVFTYDVKNAPHAERYLPDVQQWVSNGNTIPDLHAPTDKPNGLTYGPFGSLIYFPPGEVGPGLLLPDGTVFASGTHTAIYSPGADSLAPGSWRAGPDFPNGDSDNDTGAVLLPSGHVLLQGIASGQLYEFDGVRLTAVENVKAIVLLTLPDGNALVYGPSGPEIYQPQGRAQAAWAPTLLNYPAVVTRGASYTLEGTQFNGLSQGASYGDEFETATNYPLVRLTNVASGHVVYARTHDHSTMGVATGSALVSTHFDVPGTVEVGTTSLEVVANGIASTAVTISVN